MKTQDLPHRQACAVWSNRILVVSLLGIAYLTLFPFQFHFAASNVLHASPFLWGTSKKQLGHLDFYLNVLLFVPFGFALSVQVRRRGGSRWTSPLLALLAGAGVSYLVELLQFYIPARDSGWDDVISNTTGSGAGFFLFELCGCAILGKLSKNSKIHLKAGFRRAGPPCCWRFISESALAFPSFCKWKRV